MTTIKSTCQLLIFLFMCGFHALVQGQSVDSCMTSRGEQAISTCQQLIDNGSRSAAVYYQLSSQLYQNKRNDEALTTVNKGLSIHPGNKLLTNLKNNMVIGTEEQRELVRSAQKNQSAMTRGQLKITCLTKSGREGIAACRGYLSQTNLDGDRIKAREQKLLAELGGSQPSTTSVASSTSSATASSTPRTTSSAADREKQQLVKTIQSELASFGFNVGTADGIVGRKTRTALAEFYQRQNLSGRTELDSTTLTDLRTAKLQLNSAELLLQSSREAAANGSIATAIQMLESAEQTSIFLRVPTAYRQNLSIKLAQDSNRPATTPSNNNLPVVKTETPTSEGNNDTTVIATNTVTEPSVKPITPAQNETGGQQQLAQLLVQIKALESRVNLRVNNNRRQNQLLRNEIESLFNR